MADVSPEWHRPDVVGVVALLCLTWGVVALPVVQDSWVRTAVAIPVTVVVPGYAVYVVILPGAGETPLGAPLARVALAPALGVASVILVGLGLLLTPWGITPVSALSGLSALSVLCLVLAVRRRRRTAGGPTWPDANPLSFRRSFAGERSADGAVRATVAGLVVAAALLGGGATAYLSLHDQPDYAELSVAPAGEGTPPPGPNASAASIEPGETLVVYLHNQRQSSIAYTVRVLVQRVDDGRVLANRTVDTHAVTLAPNETWTERHDADLPEGWRSVRIAYLLYRGDASGDPRAQVHRWVATEGAA